MDRYYRYKIMLFWFILIIIPLLVLEMFVRGWDCYQGRGSERYLIPYASFLGYKNHPYLSYMLRPNHVPSHKKFRINEAGFKNSDEISKEKPANIVRIVCLGGSTTFDGEHGDAGTYPGKLEKILSEKYPNRIFCVINAGVPSYTALENMIDLQIRVLDYDPDIIIYY